MSLKYLPFSSLVDTTFWHILSQKKLDELKLNEEPFQATASFQTDLADGLPPLISFDYQSFIKEREDRSRSRHIITGDAIVCNTIEDFRTRDKQQLLQSFAESTWKEIEKCRQDPESVDVRSILTRFLLFTYLDLKKFIFYYWFAFPSFSWPSSVRVNTIEPVTNLLNSHQIQVLNEESNREYFLLCILSDGSIELDDVKNLSIRSSSNSCQDILIAFPDPSTSSEFPGWTARNLIVYLIRVHNISRVKLLGLRCRNNSHDCSLVFDISVDDDSKVVPDVVPDAVGWEKNEKGKLLPRKVDMSHVLDPKKLAQNAVNLNLKLMRWRLVPELNLEKVSQTKCLILGSGTLGCNVARSLLAWGVETITFVDNSRISYSNPVRQSLFTFQDCLKSGGEKAVTAAEALQNIYPGVKSTGVKLTIPMPGHSVNPENCAQVSQDVDQLESLIRDHDVVFLLMDTRESRWLPTLMARKHSKLVINAALGFDTFLVQRHGIKRKDHLIQTSSSSAPASFCPNPLSVRKPLRGSQLGCYFCNDVVAPGDSTRDRTLDQQCTVTRPGVSMIAAAYAVELMISILQHPDGADATAPPAIIRTDGAKTDDEDDDDEGEECCLGIIPHQIRGFLSRFTEVLPATAAFPNCTACSDVVMNRFCDDGFDFLLQVFNDASILEEITGLKKLHEETKLDDVWALSDNELDSDTASIRSSNTS